MPDTQAAAVRLVTLENQCTGQEAYAGQQIAGTDAPDTDCKEGSDRGTIVHAAELQVFGDDATLPQQPDGTGHGHRHRHRHGHRHRHRHRHRHGLRHRHGDGRRPDPDPDDRQAGLPDPAEAGAGPVPHGPLRASRRRPGSSWCGSTGGSGRPSPTADGTARVRCRRRRCTRGATPCGCGSVPADRKAFASSKTRLRCIKVDDERAEREHLVTAGRGRSRPKGWPRPRSACCWPTGSQVWGHGWTHTRHGRLPRRRPRSAVGEGHCRRADAGPGDGVPRGPRPARCGGRGDRPDGRRRDPVRMRPEGDSPNRYVAHVTPDAPGEWTFEIHSWSDPVATWQHDAGIKIPAGVDVELMFTEGRLLLERVAAGTGADKLDRAAASLVKGAIAAASDERRPVGARLAALQDPDLDAVLLAHPLRELTTVTGPFRFRADRERALFGSWYEFFPRSEGATRDAKTGKITSGTFGTAAKRLERVRRDGLRRRLPPADPPDRRGQPQGPQQHPHPGPRRHRLPVGDRQQGRRSRRDPPRAGHLRRLRRLRRPRRRARPRDRPRPGPAGRARTTRGSPRTRSSSPPGPTARSPTPRTRRRSTRTSTRSTSTTTRPASAARCCAS